MSHIDVGGYGEGIQPSRPLRSDFTGRVLRSTLRARRRRIMKKQYEVLSKELFSMTPIKLLRTVPGAASAMAVVAAGSVGVYALSNWFGGNIEVKQYASLFSVDLSSCKGNLPPGVNEGDNRRDVRFKITGSPHISAQALQQDLLGECEYNAVTDFYAAKFPEAGLSSTASTSTTQGFKYMIVPAKIAGISNGSIALSSTGGKAASFGTRTIEFASDVSVYDMGKAAVLPDLKPGDYVIFVAYSATADGPLTEGATILDASDTRILSIFKTQYNDGTSTSFNYQTSNVVPLDTYSQLSNRKQNK